MAQELLYTSAPKGLLPGSRGFCTVLSTEGISGQLASFVESLSSYRALYSANDPQAHLNPIVHAHVRIRVGGRSYNVLSRIAGYGLDYSQRSNKLAHHVVLESRERVVAGPAEVLSQSGCMREEYDGQPRLIPDGPTVKADASELAPCYEWQRVTGDAGWGGVLVESFLSDPTRLVYLIFEPGFDPLPLIAESIRLLPEKSRWGVTFSTFFTTFPVGVKCLWRCVLADSPEYIQSLRLPNVLRIDLTKPMDPASGGPYVESARTGIRPIRIVEEIEVEEDLSEFSRNPPPPVFPSAKASNNGAANAASAESPKSAVPTKGPPPLPKADSERRILGRAWMNRIIVLAVLSAIGVAAYVYTDQFTKNPFKSNAPANDDLPKKKLPSADPFQKIR